MEQTEELWELIIVNDGSTDKTETYIEDYLKDKRIRYIKNIENEGIGRSINKGLEVARYNCIT